MRRLLALTVGSMFGVAAVASTASRAQPAATLACSPTTVSAVGPSVTFTCSIRDFPPNTQVAVSQTIEPNSRQLTTDGVGRADFTFFIPESGVCAPRSELTINASGGGAQALTGIAVNLVPGLQADCGPVAVPIQPRLTG